MKWQTKLQYYNSYFRATYHLGDFDLPFGIDKMLCKNEALRSKNRTLFLDFLREYGAAEVEAEMRSFDHTAENLLVLDQASVQHFLSDSHVHMLQSDIWIDDEDCIFKVVDVAEKDVLFELDKTLTAIVGVNVLPQEIVGHSCVWIDVSDFSQHVNRSNLEKYRTRIAS
ncbi:hypothetical protein [Sphingobacterium paludis]|uniref:Uncharacterized protein n=1 Tax=Sphingobacterium paludis TaxID=1476465 RepID=A0A4R7DA11_9SPHI|nr:hypothetical protein [Sphingobacterium paludis]TDS17637.1 hypothetical protein B0I21_101508 [Sphingobacterium paludis]